MNNANELDGIGGLSFCFVCLLVVNVCLLCLLVVFVLSGLARNCKIDVYTSRCVRVIPAQGPC